MGLESLGSDLQMQMTRLINQDDTTSVYTGGFTLSPDIIFNVTNDSAITLTPADTLFASTYQPSNGGTSFGMNLPADFWTLNITKYAYNAPESSGDSKTGTKSSSGAGSASGSGKSGNTILKKYKYHDYIAVISSDKTISYKDKDGKAITAQVVIQNGGSKLITTANDYVKSLA